MKFIFHVCPISLKKPEAFVDKKFLKHFPSATISVGPSMIHNLQETWTLCRIWTGMMLDKGNL